MLRILYVANDIEHFAISNRITFVLPYLCLPLYGRGWPPNIGRCIRRIADRPAPLLDALRMKQRRGPRLSKAACIVAMIPCVGPCFVLGLPFGIWGWVVMNDHGVEQAFAGIEASGSGRPM